MLIRVTAISLLSFVLLLPASSATLFDPFYLYENPEKLNLRSSVWNLIYRAGGASESLVLRHAESRVEEIMSVVNAAREQGKKIRIMRKGLVQQKYSLRHGLEVVKSSVDYVCSECAISEVIEVSDEPLDFQFISVSTQALAFTRNAYRLAFSSDEKWNLHYKGKSRPIWITKRVADHLRTIANDHSTLLLNLRAFLDPSLTDDPNRYMEFLDLKLLAKGAKTTS